jgi:hypothetical protein
MLLPGEIEVSQTYKGLGAAEPPDPVFRLKHPAPFWPKHPGQDPSTILPIELLNEPGRQNPGALESLHLVEGMEIRALFS